MESALFHDINNYSFLNNSTYWTKYENILNGMSAEQRQYIAKNEDVINKKEVMLNAFLDYLFEQYKDSFVSVQNGIYKPIADEYIESVKAAGETYISRSEQLENENAELKKKLKELLEKGKNDNGKNEVTASGIRQD